MKITQKELNAKENEGFFFSPDVTIPEDIDWLDPENEDHWESIYMLTEVLQDLENQEPVLHSVGERLRDRNCRLRSNGIYVSNWEYKEYGGISFEDDYVMFVVREGEIIGCLSQKELDDVAEKWMEM